MASRSVSAAVKSRLAANPIANWPVYGPNELGEAPDDGSPFIAYEFPLTVPPEQKTIGSPGSNRVREYGAILLIIASERSGGIDAGLAVADTLMDLFRNAQFDGVRCWLPSPPATDDQNQDGNYFKLLVSVPFWFDADNG